MTSRIATVLAISMAVSKSFAAKCKWSGSECEFDASNIQKGPDTKMGKWSAHEADEKECNTKITEASCKDPCTWRKYEGKCENGKNFAAEFYTDADFNGCQPDYKGMMLGCDKADTAEACKAASTKCVWNAADPVPSSDDTVEQIKKNDTTCYKVSIPKRVGRCENSRAMLYCSSLTADVDLNKMYLLMTCVSAVDWSECMKRMTNCTAFHAESAKKLMTNQTNAAQYEVRKMYNTCAAAQTCKAYADAMFPYPATLDAYVAEKDMESKDCFSFKNKTTCSDDACFWSPHESSGTSTGACKNKIHVLSEFKRKDQHANCMFVKAEKANGRYPDTEAKRLDLYNKRQECPTLAETACKNEQACKWEMDTVCKSSDDGKAPSGNVSRCDWSEKEERAGAEGLAAQKAVLELYLGVTDDGVASAMHSCKVLTDKTSCEGEKMTEAETAAMQSAGTTGTSGSTSGATRSYGDLSTLGLVASCIAIVALTQG